MSSMKTQASRLSFGRTTESHSRVGSRVGRRIEFVSVVLPCLNEEDAVGPTVAEAYRGLARAGYPGEVIVVDNGSTDSSVERARAAGARIVHEPRRGYGAAHLAGVRAARGNVVVMADADLTYDLENLGDLLVPLAEGADMVVASRVRGTIAAGAMPPLHRYVGTPLITCLLRLLTGVSLSDSQSGYRAFWRNAVLALNLKAPGMEYASEMLLKAGRAGMILTEVPTQYRARVGESKLNTFHDGWRHLRMLLLLSPHMALIFPGLTAMMVGLLLSGVSLVAPGGLNLGGLHWLPVFLGPMLLILGAQAFVLGSLAAYRSALTPAPIRARLAFLDRNDAVNRLLTWFLITALIGMVLNSILLILWLARLSSVSLLGLAGIAQALVVIGLSGIVTVFAADYSRSSLGLDDVTTSAALIPMDLHRAARKQRAKRSA